MKRNLKMGKCKRKHFFFMIPLFLNNGISFFLIMMAIDLIMIVKMTPHMAAFVASSAVVFIF